MAKHFALIGLLAIVALTTTVSAQSYLTILQTAEQSLPQLLTSTPSVIVTTLKGVIVQLNSAEQQLIQNLITTIDGLLQDLEKTLNDLLNNLGGILGTVNGLLDGAVGGVTNGTNGGGLLSSILGRKKRGLLDLSGILGQLGGLLALPQNLLQPILGCLAQICVQLNLFSILNVDLFAQLAFLPLELVGVVWGLLMDLLSIQLVVDIVPAIQLLNLNADVNLLTVLEAEVQANATIGAILGPFCNGILLPILQNTSLDVTAQLAQIYAAIQLDLFANNGDLLDVLVNIQLPGILSLGLFLDVGKIFYIIECLPVANLGALLTGVQALNVSALTTVQQGIIANFTAELQTICNGGGLDIAAALSALNGAVTAVVLADINLWPLLAGVLLTIEGIVVTLYDIVIAAVVQLCLPQLLGLVPLAPIGGGLLGNLLATVLSIL